MPNIGSMLKGEISRLARKEVRSQTKALKKASAQYRKRLAEMKRLVLELQHKVAKLEKQLSGADSAPPQTTKTRTRSYRFSPKGLQSKRKRLGLSAADFGKLVGVTGQTIYKWEKGLSRPRHKQLAALAAVRNMGKKEALERLKELG